MVIPRLSGNSDIIPITISERLIKEDTLQEGKQLLIKGQFRSYNSYENEKNRLILTVFAKDIVELEEKEDQEENEKVLEIMNLIGKKRGAVISGGEINIEKVANILIDDFRSGKLGKITLEKVK